MATWLVAVALSLAAGHARADGILVSDDGRADQHGFDVFVGFDGKSETLIEQVRIVTDASRLGWIRAFPSEPSEILDVDPGIYGALAEMTRAEAPYNDAIKEDFFGPSLVSLIRRRFAAKPVTATEPADYSAKRFRVAGDRVVTFRGMAQTSSITREIHLPEALASWLVENDFTLTRAERTAIIRYLNSGWVLVASVIDTRARTGSVRATVGPTLYRFETDTAFHPILLTLARPEASTPFDYYLLAPKPLVPAEFDAVWDEDPWNPQPPAGNLFVARFNRTVDRVDTTDLLPILGQAPPADATLVAGTFRFKSLPKRDMQFRPAKAAVEIPADPGPGSPLDILLCVVLGVAPLLYTPESWFLLWIAARSKARAALDKTRARGALLWPLYAIGVGAYWGLTLEGMARIAALLPILVGVARMVSAYPGVGARPIRVQFAKANPPSGDA